MRPDVILATFWMIVHQANCQRTRINVPVVPIGFYRTIGEDDFDLEAAFNSISKLQAEGAQVDGFRIQPYIVEVKAGDLLESHRAFCNLVSKGAMIHFLPRSMESARFIAKACDRLDVICFDVFQRSETFGSETPVTVAPSAQTIGTAAIEVLDFLGHNRTAIIMDDPADLKRIDAVINEAKARRIGVEIYFANGETFRTLLSHLRDDDATAYIVALKKNTLPQFIQNVFQLNMHDEKYSYLFIELNSLMVDMEDISYLGADLISFSLLDFTNKMIFERISEMQKDTSSGSLRNVAAAEFQLIPLEAALILDAVDLVRKALSNFAPLPADFSSSLSCSRSSPWPHGSSMLNFFGTIGVEGISGTIRLDGKFRSETILDILNLTETGQKKLGYWSSSTGLHPNQGLQRGKTRHESGKVPAGTAEDPLIVVSVLHEPFLMLKDEIKREVMLARRELDLTKITEEHVQGFVIDLLTAISNNMEDRGGKGFKYKLYLVPDGQFGIQDPETGEWNGMMKELLNGKASLAVAPFTVTAFREEYISFTKPFMTAGIGILYQAPRGAAPNLFALMRSLSPELWLASLGATVIVGFSLWIIARFSPLEWESRHFCTGLETKFAVNTFNLRNSLWFAMCSLMMQGCDLNPRAVSTRLLGGIWWFYTLFLSAHFIAKLASVLTVEKMSVPFHNVDELVKHPEITFGILHNGSTFEFFRDSKIDIYKEMFEHLETRAETAYMKNYQDGIQKVMNEKFAFLMESTEIEYLIERNCNVTQIGGTLNTIQYGIGTPKDSQWMEKLSMAILHLIENSAIPQLQEKWWKRGAVCTKDDKSSGPSPITFILCGGVFLILGVGVIIAVAVAVVEFIWNALHNARIKKTSLGTEFMTELRYALHFRASSTRPVLQRMCRTCGVEIRSLAAAQAHEHRDYTPMRFLDSDTANGRDFVDLQRRRALADPSFF